MKIAVLASTRGTDLQAIMDEIASGALDVELSVVISNKKDCFAVSRAKNAGYDTLFIDPKGKTREEFDAELLESLKRYDVSLIVLVGYMKILGESVVSYYKNKIINVHPSLMPAFCGKDFYDASVHQAVLDRGVKVTGCTIHFVNEICDGGPIILQKTVEVADDDTVETLKEKVQDLEKKWYPEVIRWIEEGRVEVVGGKVIIS